MLDFSKDGNTEFFGWPLVGCLLGFFGLVWFCPFFPPKKTFSERVRESKSKILSLV